MICRERPPPGRAMSGFRCAPGGAIAGADRRWERAGRDSLLGLDPTLFAEATGTRRNSCSEHECLAVLGKRPAMSTSEVSTPDESKPATAQVTLHAILVWVIGKLAQGSEQGYVLFDPVPVSDLATCSARLPGLSWHIGHRHRSLLGGPSAWTGC